MKCYDKMLFILGGLWRGVLFWVDGRDYFGVEVKKLLSFLKWNFEFFFIQFSHGVSCYCGNFWLYCLKNFRFRFLIQFFTSFGLYIKNALYLINLDDIFTCVIPHAFIQLVHYHMHLLYTIQRYLRHYSLYIFSPQVNVIVVTISGIKFSKPKSKQIKM